MKLSQLVAEQIAELERRVELLVRQTANLQQALDDWQARYGPYERGRTLPDWHPLPLVPSLTPLSTAVVDTALYADES